MPVPHAIRRKPSVSDSLGTLLRRVTNPPRLPPAAARTVAIVVPLLTLADAALIAHGVRTGDAGKHFGEWRIGTYLNALVLVIAGALCALPRNAAAALPAQLGAEKGARFWHWFGWILIFLSLDDLLRVHEHIDMAVHGALGLDSAHAITDHLDDLIVALYGLGALCHAWVHRAHLLRLNWTLTFLAIAGGFVAGMVALDVLVTADHVEESLKLIGAGFILVAVVTASVELRSTAEAVPEPDQAPSTGPLGSC